MGFFGEFKEGVKILADPEKRSLLIDGITHFNEYKDKGSAGERHIYRILDDYFEKSLILRNVYLPKKNGMTTEIDLLGITEQGLLVIESKNYSGTIYGSQEQKQWTHYLTPQSKFSFANPINQNTSHIKALQLALDDFPEVVYYNLVVFSERCTLKIGEVSAPNTYVIQRFDLDALLAKIVEQKGVLHFDRQADIALKLTRSSRPKKEVREQHVEDLKTKCQFCGSDLVERVRKKDGGRFLGCSTYPKCRFTKQGGEQRA